MRPITAEPILATARPGCADSAAAMVVISAPVIAKKTVGTAASTAIQPCGVNPPWSLRLPNVAPCGAVHPNAYDVAIAMNTTMAATLMHANQNSNSAKDRADINSTQVLTIMNTTPQ